MVEGTGRLGAMSSTAMWQLERFTAIAEGECTAEDAVATAALLTESDRSVVALRLGAMLVAELCRSSAITRGDAVAAWMRGATEPGLSSLGAALLLPHLLDIEWESFAPPANLAAFEVSVGGVEPPAGLPRTTSPNERSNYARWYLLALTHIRVSAEGLARDHPGAWRDWIETSIQPAPEGDEPRTVLATATDLWVTRIADELRSAARRLFQFTPIYRWTGTLDNSRHLQALHNTLPPDFRGVLGVSWMMLSLQFRAARTSGSGIGR